MLTKLLTLLPLLFSSNLNVASDAWAWFPYPYTTDITVENHVLTSVNDKDTPNVRIYAEQEVTTIGEHAFDDCSFSTLMISKTVKDVQATYPDTLGVIYFTGALSEIEFDYPNNVVVYEYGCDEGFLNYWTLNIRPNTDGSSICNVTREHYVKMKQLYNELETHDRNTVDAKKDGTGTIYDSVKYLDSYFSGRSSSQNTTKEIPQTVMIILILIVASFGMTSIGIFYIFKDKKIIG